MRYRILKCVSPTCAKAGEDGRKCPWRAKVLTCRHRSIVDIFEVGQHIAQCADPPSGNLSEKNKDVARSLAQVFVKPVRIRNRIADENGGLAPSLDKLQHFVSYYRKTKMNNSDDVNELEKMI
ncbi:hypothetical protein JG688_00017570 [Phytophthora aleatoria]|uniref:Uncharacterized protein n=1 Tax=Phytophthora aleatoria TaxID=2496075 RepID=A0A8J5IH81_9STRA|nr:hypothetical protein JG688_00017570 [Phytophthora aleatoria]